MNGREKLIELLQQTTYIKNYLNGAGEIVMSIERHYLDESDAEDVADHLIANGVVVQEEAEWILTDGWRCSRCLSLCPFTCDEQEDLSNYCPNCGAKMNEVK